MTSKIEQKRLFDFAIELTILIHEIYMDSPVGGALHIVLDDGNTEDYFINWCIENSIAKLPGDRKDMYERCAKMLLEISESERLDFIATHFSIERKWGVRNG